MSLQRSVSTQKALEEDLQVATKKIYQLTAEKEAQMEEFNKAKAGHSFVVTELKTSICNLKELLTTEQQRLEKRDDQLRILTVELQKKSSELEEMTKLKNNQELELEELKKILCNNLRKQVENKSKCIEELQQENKALKKRGTAESKQLNIYEIKVSKLELELEGAKQKFKEMTDNYQKKIEDKNISEENLLEEVEKAKVIANEAVKLQKEIDIRCQHKIAEMVALMEKHKVMCVCNENY
uniref:Uncharacterized protein n=1 Tax=Mustela putorius furo TaxID=9669 RepID=M3XRM4_MUSPF